MDKYAKHITPRAIKFPPPKHGQKFWHSNAPAPTYTFNTLALYLPLLEKMVVLSLKQSVSKLKNTNLKQEVQSLIAQEAYHGSEYARMLPSLIYQHYPNIQKKYKFRVFGSFALLINKILPNFHYALSAAGEHFTAISADLFLRQPKYFKDVAPEYSAIWRWHAIEEIEHKTVAFDVYQYFSSSYIQRISAMLIMTIVFCTFMFKPIWQMMCHDQNHKKLNFYRSLFKYHWGKGGLWRGLLKPYFYYYHPRFHPNKINNHNLIADWKLQLSKHSSNHQDQLNILKYLKPESS